MGPFPERERTKKRSPSVVRAFQVPTLDRLAEMKNRKLELPTEIRMVSISHTYYSIASVSFKSYITSHHLMFEGIDEFSGVECVKMYVRERHTGA